MKDPDWPAFHAVTREAEELHDAGRMDRDEFRRLWQRAKRALNGHDGFLEALTVFGEPNWLD